MFFGENSSDIELAEKPRASAEKLRLSVIRNRIDICRCHTHLLLLAGLKTCVFKRSIYGNLIYQPKVSQKRNGEMLNPKLVFATRSSNFFRIPLFRILFLLLMAGILHHLGCIKPYK